MSRSRQIHRLAIFAALWCLSGGGPAFTSNVIDTMITGNGTPGPYGLGSCYVDMTSVRVAFADTSRGLAPPFTYVGTVNGLLFAEPIDSGARLSVSFRIAFPGVRKTFSLYEKMSIDAADTAAFSPRVRPAGGRPADAAEKLTLSGYKSVGISLGNQGQMNLQQALDVTLFGEISPRTRISGHISDQGTSLDGATREIGELDRVYITLTNPAFHVTVGDQYQTWPVRGLLAEQKKIKGISAGISPGRFTVNAFGALSGGKFAAQTIRGFNGRQGPYHLTGNGEPDIISPIGGTVNVSVDGKVLAEGENHDYVVDYDLGTITFTPTFLITDDKLVRAEYEYKTFDYQRSMAGADLGYAAADSLLTVRGAVWYEADNERQPLDFTLTGTDIARLREAGDSTASQLYVRPVHPQDVAATDALYPLYRLDPNGRYTYTRFDPENPADNRGFYRITFIPADSATGNYAPVDTVSVHGIVYGWAGEGMGTAIVPRTLPLPQRTIIGETALRLNPVEWIMADVIVAGESRDRNTFSPLDDEDNNGAATSVSLRLGKKNTERRAFWLEGAHRLTTRDFTREVFSVYEQEKTWFSRRVSEMRADRQSWTAGGGIMPWTGVSAEGSYGQMRYDSAVTTDRISASATIAPGPRLRGHYRGNFFRHFDSLSVGRTRTDELGCALKLKHSDYAVRLFDEWHSSGSDTAAGHVGIGGNVSLNRIGLRESLSYSQQHRAPARAFFFTDKSDTGYTVLWEQSLSGTPAANWKAGAASSWHRRATRRDTLNTVLVSVTSQASAPRRGFSTHQEYRVSAERVTAFIQVPKYMGAGLGTHRYDRALGEYVPDHHGDYILIQQEAYDTSGGRPVRTADLNVSWSLNPRNPALIGLLRDLRWRGTLGIREHIFTDREVTGLSWIPSYMTFSSLSSGDSALSHATCYYRQDITWRPDSFPGYQANLQAKPFIRKIRTISEAGFEGTLGFERTLKKWVFSAGSSFLWLDHEREDGSERFEVTDIGPELGQKYLLPRDLNIYIKERGGWARKRRESVSDSGWYFMLIPGAAWQPSQRGWAEASYTLALVDIDGDLDFRMAGGRRSGLSHIFDIYADIKISAHFNISATYRGELRRRFGASEYDEKFHVISLEVKALL